MLSKSERSRRSREGRDSGGVSESPSSIVDHAAADRVNEYYATKYSVMREDIGKSLRYWNAFRDKVRVSRIIDVEAAWWSSQCRNVRYVIRDAQGQRELIDEETVLGILNVLCSTPARLLLPPPVLKKKFKVKKLC